MIKELKKMAEEGVTDIEIYYAEDIEDKKEIEDKEEQKEN